jgi:hypothetical protein
VYVYVRFRYSGCATKINHRAQTDLYGEWRPFYLDYNRLKRELKVRPDFLHVPTDKHSLAYFIKARTTSHNWHRDDEVEFIRMLESELDKIHDFQKSKVCPRTHFLLIVITLVGFFRPPSCRVASVMPKNRSNS